MRSAFTAAITVLIRLWSCRKTASASRRVTLLGHRNNLATLFAADLWPKQPEQALLVLEKVPARYAAQLDQPKIARELALARLARRAPDKGIAP